MVQLFSATFAQTMLITFFVVPLLPLLPNFMLRLFLVTWVPIVFIIFVLVPPLVLLPQVTDLAGAGCVELPTSGAVQLAGVSVRRPRGRWLCGTPHLLVRCSWQAFPYATLAGAGCVELPTSGAVQLAGVSVRRPCGRWLRGTPHLWCGAAGRRFCAPPSQTHAVQRSAR